MPKNPTTAPDDIEIIYDGASTSNSKRRKISSSTHEVKPEVELLEAEQPGFEKLLREYYRDVLEPKTCTLSPKNSKKSSYDLRNRTVKTSNRKKMKTGVKTETTSPVEPKPSTSDLKSRQQTKSSKTVKDGKLVSTKTDETASHAVAEMDNQFLKMMGKISGNLLKAFKEFVQNKAGNETQTQSASTSSKKETEASTSKQTGQQSGQITNINIHGPVTMISGQNPNQPCSHASATHTGCLSAFPTPQQGIQSHTVSQNFEQQTSNKSARNPRSRKSLMAALSRQRANEAEAAVQDNTTHSESATFLTPQPQRHSRRTSFALSRRSSPYPINAATSSHVQTASSTSSGSFVIRNNRTSARTRPRYARASSAFAPDSAPYVINATTSGYALPASTASGNFVIQSSPMPGQVLLQLQDLPYLKKITIKKRTI